MKINKELFHHFFTEVGKKYVDILASGQKYIIVDLDELKEYDENLALMIINKAKFSIPVFKEALNDELKKKLESNSIDDFDVGFNGECIPRKVIHEISSTDFGKLIKIRGFTTRIHDVKPMATVMAFRCPECFKNNSNSTVFYIPQINPFNITTPSKTCPDCGNNVQYLMLEDLSEYVDSQEFSLQESYEDCEGRIPQLIHLITTMKHLINTVYVGENIEVVGLVKLMPTYRFRNKSRFFTPYIEIIDIYKDSKNPENITISPEEEQQIIALSKEEGIYEKMIYNITPSIVGMEKFKEAILLVLFGGVEKIKSDVKIRGNIHICCVGDGGLGKSQILNSILSLAPKAILSVGEGISGAGLTAACTKDEATGEFVIEAGTLVLANKGIALVDEIDKMRPEDRQRMHEALEQGTVTIHKAGKHLQLSANMSLIAVGNPIGGRYDTDKSVFENVKFPPTLWSRFDLIFVVTDNPNQENDARIAEHIINNANNEPTIDRKLFRKYIAYAKRINPVFSRSALEKLKEHYLRVRNAMSINQSKAPINTRQLEGLVRLSEAHARALLKKKVDESDAEAAIKLFNKYLEDINFDIDCQMCGESPEKKTVKDIMEGIFKQLSIFHPNGVPHSLWVEEAKKSGIEKNKALNFIKEMYDASMILIASEDYNEKYYKKAF